MKDRGLCVILLLLLMVSPIASSAPMERIIPVSVNIVTNQHTLDLEIVASKNSFLLTYGVASQQFLPLNIPFKVKSLGGLLVSYNLSLSQLGGRCDENTSLVPTAMLDGTDVRVDQLRRFDGVVNEHVLTLSFPLLPQMDFTLQCEGYVGVVAELVI